MPQTTETAAPSPSLRYYACGEVDQSLGRLFRNQEPEVRTFPAGAFLYENITGERVLFDTGYATSVYSSGAAARIYSRLLPFRVKEEDEIHNQLQADGIKPSTIGRVVLSHLHPDHIGGVQFFPDAQFILSAEAEAALTNPNLFDGIFRKILPKWFDEVPKLILDDEQLGGVAENRIGGYDLLGESSFLLTKLPGHARGQIGALVLDSLVLAADAAWSKDLLDQASNLRLPAKLITHDTEAYRTTAKNLLKLEACGIKLCFSHDTYDSKVLVP